jgi:hypothetical protein
MVFAFRRVHFCQLCPPMIYVETAELAKLRNRRAEIQKNLLLYRAD